MRVPLPNPNCQLMQLMFTLLTMKIVEGCISHTAAWECAFDHASFGRHCVTPADIHRRVQQSDVLSQPLLLAIEGPHYQKLFSDCDGDGDGCISKDEIMTEPCVRDCRWRNLFVQMTCLT